MYPHFSPNISNISSPTHGSPGVKHSLRGPPPPVSHPSVLIEANLLSAEQFLNFHKFKNNLFRNYV